MPEPIDPIEPPVTDETERVAIKAKSYGQWIKSIVAKNDRQAALFAEWQKVMSKSKAVETDTKGVYSDYPSHLACVQKIEELIRDTGIAYYQRIEYNEQAIGIETVITHTGGETLPTGTVYIPLGKRDAVGVASAIGWAKRLSLVHAFSLGTLEREMDPKDIKPMHGLPSAPPAAVSLPALPDSDLPPATIDERIAQINTALTVEALNRLYKTFPKDVQKDDRIINACTDRKIAITEPPK